jgi:hypothetical protein
VLLVEAHLQEGRLRLELAHRVMKRCNIVVDPMDCESPFEPVPVDLRASVGLRGEKGVENLTGDAEIPRARFERSRN